MGGSTGTAVARSIKTRPIKKKKKKKRGKKNELNTYTILKKHFKILTILQAVLNKTTKKCSLFGGGERRGESMPRTLLAVTQKKTCPADLCLVLRISDQSCKCKCLGIVTQSPEPEAHDRHTLDDQDFDVKGDFCGGRKPRETGEKVLESD